jgi:hypothetical protein
MICIHRLMFRNGGRDILQWKPRDLQLYSTDIRLAGSSELSNNLNIQKRFSASLGEGCWRCSREGKREVHDDAYWRLISIETPLLHTRCCRTDDLPHVILRHLRDVQLYAKRKPLSGQFRKPESSNNTYICCTEHSVWPDWLSLRGSLNNASGQECLRF